MKNLIILICLIISGLIYSQNEPTKQETMDWIAKKLKENLQSPRTFVSYEFGRFTYRSPNYKKVTINLNNITWVIAGNFDPIRLRGKNVVYYEEDGYDNEFNFSGVVNGEFYNVFDFSNEYAINLRVRKALEKLVEYNLDKGKEPF